MPFISNNMTSSYYALRSHGLTGGVRVCIVDLKPGRRITVSCALHAQLHLVNTKDDFE